MNPVLQAGRAIDDRTHISIRHAANQRKNEADAPGRRRHTRSNFSRPTSDPGGKPLRVFPGWIPVSQQPVSGKVGVASRSFLMRMTRPRGAAGGFLCFHTFVPVCRNLRRKRGGKSSNNQRVGRYRFTPFEARGSEYGRAGSGFVLFGRRKTSN